MDQIVDATFLALPEDGNLAGYGASEIRKEKTAWAERLAAEHELDTGIAGDQTRHGAHRAGSAVVYVRTASDGLPTTRANGEALSTDVSKTLDDGLLVVLVEDVGSVRRGLYVRRASTLAGGLNEPPSDSPAALHKGWVRATNADFIYAATHDAGVTVEGVKLGGGDGQTGFLVAAATGVALRGGKIADGEQNTLPGETVLESMSAEPMAGQSDNIVLRSTNGSIKVRSVILSGEAPASPVDGEEWFVG